MKNIFLYYLRILAKLQILKIRPVIIGIGGAAGKTSLVNFISIILRTKYSVLETKGKNSETGIPLGILGISVKDYSLLDWLRVGLLAPLKVIFNWKKYDYFVAEMGIDGPYEPKNMSYLLKIVKPKIAVVTNIALEHSEYFDNFPDALEAIAQQEILLLKSLQREGIALINLDDRRIAKLSLNSSKITISAKDKADFYIKSVHSTIDAFEVDFIYNKDSYKAKLGSPLPKYYAFSIVASLGIAQRVGFSVQGALDILQNNFSLPAGRFSIFQGIKNSIILDSSYNSSPVAAKEAIELLSEISEGRRKVAILGDMRELGKESKDAHMELGKLVLQNADFAILIGPEVSSFTASILEKSSFEFLAFPDFTSARESIIKNIREKDVVLIKGSQNTLYLERVVEILLKNSQDKDKLARRGDFWEKKRKESK